MSVYFESHEATVHHGDCLDVLHELDDESVDAVITDPPYGLANTDPTHVTEAIIRWVNGDRDYLPGGRGFMGNAWDAFVPPVAVWDECMRVLKPGGHALVFAGSRTVDLMGLSLRLAGFDIRDSIAWLYGSGFPKTSVDDEGRSTALKPAFEPIVLARKPLAGTVVANLLAHGTGALNVDATRIAHDEKSAAWVEQWSGDKGHPAGMFSGIGTQFGGSAKGRFPANVVLDESQAAVLDAQSGIQRDGTAVNRNRGDDERASWYGTRKSQTGADVGYGGEGGASRFFYTSKASSAERPVVDGVAHPTVKPLDLMRWLVRLVTPPNGVVLEPFAGSGTTLEAALAEGLRCIGIEREATYLPLIRQRISKPIQQSLLGDWEEAS